MWIDVLFYIFFFFSSRRRHTRCGRDWSSDVCSSDLQTSEEGIEALRRRLNAMCRDGQLICNRRNAFLPIESARLETGRVVGHKDGFGFLVPDGGGSDLFLSARQMREVFHGDRVVARVDRVDDRGRREG